MSSEGARCRLVLTNGLFAISVNDGSLPSRFRKQLDSALGSPETRTRKINRTQDKPSYVAGLNLQLPFVLAGARVSTRFAHMCASQCQLA